MRTARFTVDRPIFTIMGTLIAVTLGLIALGRLPIDLLPDITYPTLTISTGYSNASPLEMEQLVTRVVEQAVAVVPGVEQITSVSSEGNSSVRVSFSWGSDLDVASNYIRDRLDRVLNALPDDAQRPQIRKFDANARPILVLGMGGNLDPIELRQLVDEQMSYRIERISGVAAVDIWGGLEREIQVNVQEDKVKAFGLGLDRVREAIQAANATVPAGELERGNLSVMLRTPGEFTSLEQLRNTVVAVRDGVPVYVHQIADVDDTHRRVTQLIRINGQPGIRVAVRKQSDRNTVEIARAVHAEIGRLRTDFPQVEIVAVTDSARYIQRAIDNLTRSILYGGVLAVLVLLVLLRDLRATMVAAIAIPISVVTTFALIYFGGFTLNLMTLGALALGVGMMVDNAIVVLENIARLRQQEGRDARGAAIQGTEQVATAIVASTITTVVIFLPMIFAQEMAGILFRQFAWVVGFALLCSLAVSLTLVPMLAARFAATASAITAQERGNAAPAGGRRVLDVAERGFMALEARYLGLLDLALSQRGATVAFAVVLFAGSLLLIPRLGAEFMPAADENEVRVTVEMESGTRLAVLDESVRRVERIVAAAVPEAVATIVRSGGGGGRGSAARGEIVLTLVSAPDRDRSSEGVAMDLRGLLADIPGVVIRTRAGQGLTMVRSTGGGEDAEAIEIDVRGYDFATLDALAAEVQSAIADVPGITDVRLGREAGNRHDVFRIDRDRAADLGLSVALIGRTLETAIAGSGAGDYREGGDEFRIVVRLNDAERMTVEQVLDLSAINDTGEQVALRNVLGLDTERAPLRVERKDQQRTVAVSANIAGRDLGSVVADIETRLQTIPLPRNYGLAITGDYEEQQKAFRELLLNILFAVALVYMVLACLYESLVDPLIVMVSVPFAVIGVIAALLATGSTLNVQSFIGCVMLVGIVVNNAILIVDQAGQLHRSEGVAPFAAAREAGRRRLRPILMTSLTTMLALVPLALGIGEGAETQAPLARAVIGGLASSMLITLVVIPVLYTLVHRAVPAAAPDPAQTAVAE